MVIHFILAPALWAVEDPKLEDFDGTMVFSGSEGSLLMLELPEEVYRGLKQKDLGDLRIFDASKKPLPFIIRNHPKEVFTPFPEEVPFFVWDGGRENQFPANTDIEINTSGGVVRIKNQGSFPGSSPVYLVDCSLLDYVPSSLRIESLNQGKNYNSLVSIHYSKDLSNWISFDKKQILASFGMNVQDTLELPAAENMKYLLVNFEGGAPPPVRMTVFFAPEERDGVYHELIVQGRKSKDGKKVQYVLESYFPIESIDFILAEADSIPVLVKNRYSEKDEWNVQVRGAIFRYNSAGNIVKNKPFIITSQAPYWELETTGELLFSTAPECVIRWKQRELIFPARGNGPWTLAYGNAACAPFGTGELLPPGGSEEPEKAVFTGEKHYEKKNLSSSTVFTSRNFIPWVLLGAAVIILSLLAFHIAKSMKKYYHNQ